MKIDFLASPAKSYISPYSPKISNAYMHMKVGEGRYTCTSGLLNL